MQLASLGGGGIIFLPFVSGDRAPVTGSGTRADPWDLATALSSPDIAPGDTLLLAAGTYRGDFVCLLNGSPGKPITVKPVPGARAILDGNFARSGNYVEFRDLEFCYTGWPARHTENEGSDPVDLEPERAVSLGGDGVKYINCILHDLHNGFAGGGGAALAYGCLIYYCGWSAPDRGHGHGMYVQHTGTPALVLENNIIFSNFELGIKVYTEGTPLDNVAVRRNTVFCANDLYQLVGTQNKKWNLLLGGYQMFENPEIRENCTWHRPAVAAIWGNQVGWVGGASDVVMVDNYFPEGVFHYDPELVTFSENSGNYIGPEVGNTVFVRPNDYQAGRANVTIYNQAGADSVRVDVAAALKAGQAYKLRNVQDYFGDIRAGTVGKDGAISVDMRAASHTVATPIMWPVPPTVFPAFGCFVLEPA